LSVAKAEADVGRTAFEELEVYRLSEKLADLLWSVVRSWDSLARDTVGKQLIRAADSIGANIAEGTGRGSFQDNRRFTKISRGSLNETKHWLRRAFTRGLITESQVKQIRPLMDELSPRLNAYLRSIGPVAAERLSRSATDNGQLTTDK
jgi:four helix bundle protein